MDITSFVESTYDLFECFDKPDFATDINSCQERRDHNDEINGENRRNLLPEQIGTASWGIFSYLTPQAMGYYMPRFIELAVTGQNGKNNAPYMCQFIDQVGFNSESEQFSLFSKEQRLAILDSLHILKKYHINTLTEHWLENDIDPAINQWST